MLNEVYDTVEAILEGLDTGGEPSRAYAEEIKMLREILGYQDPASDALDAAMRRYQIARKLERLAIEAQDVTVALPAVPITKWLDATSTNAVPGASTEPCDLARLLQVLCDTIRAELN
ncbi:MAG: hypothetical protein RBS72_21550 [Sedimentisphaerales bacterium]|jgi:hypothetical protein|nr:hypothetical protein [Sedimentisphaerales bacterium]HOH65615.1 hypothetical protein [Sedimentisphaerales bacterium]HQA90995.1 hypothetical protein [Sedimentisphaerales bacterium]HQN36019.1 hypothetical protein [Sedimentisphaerales bacterium]